MENKIINKTCDENLCIKNIAATITPVKISKNMYVIEEDVFKSIKDMIMELIIVYDKILGVNLKLSKSINGISKYIIRTTIKIEMFWVYVIKNKPINKILSESIKALISLMCFESHSKGKSERIR